jgi:type II secretory pathway component GspD/PulD (secretin)
MAGVLGIVLAGTIRMSRAIGPTDPPNTVVTFHADADEGATKPPAAELLPATSSSSSEPASPSSPGSRLRQLFSRPSGDSSSRPVSDSSNRDPGQGRRNAASQPTDRGKAADDHLGNRIRIPLGTSPSPDRVQIKQQDGLLSLSVRETPVNRLMLALGQYLHLSIVCSDSVATPISLTLERASLEQSLDAICGISSCAWVQRNGVIYVTSTTSSTKLSGDLQGRQIRTFRLDYAAAADAETAIKGLLSPVGQSFITQTKINDNKRTNEMIVVYDLPGYLPAIEQYVEKLDHPPRQVMIEAHVLAISLNSTNQWGVDLNSLFNTANGAGFKTTGFADPNAANGFLFTFNSHDLKVVVEALKTQTNAKTLASPKLLVLNGQEAHIQIGQQLGYRVTTTTETSTMENVNFLNVGVLLKVTPRITQEHQIMMHVKPEVSKGEISAVTELPNSDTTTVETDIMLSDGRGMVIGGLIQEKDSENQSKVPILGDLWLIGRLFQKQTITKERQEIIITLVPHIVPDCLVDNDRHAEEVLRTETPLLCGPLDRVSRPWEPRLPDAFENPWRLKDHTANRCKGERLGSDGSFYRRPNQGPSSPYYERERRPESCPPEPNEPLPPEADATDSAMRPIEATQQEPPNK